MNRVIMDEFAIILCITVAAATVLSNKLRTVSRSQCVPYSGRVFWNYLTKKDDITDVWQPRLTKFSKLPLTKIMVVKGLIKADRLEDHSACTVKSLIEHCAATKGNCLNLFQCKQRQNENRTGPLVILDEILLKEVNSTKFLEIYIDRGLNWDSHIDNVCLKMTKAWQVVCEGCARLPVLDTGACLPQPVCNPRSPFRTPDGSCTNLHHPSWAQVSSPYARFKPANYHDDKKELRRSVNGLPLPPVRQLSYNFFPDCFAEDCKYTLMMMQWGQFMAHDITHLRNLVLGDGSAIKCCTNDGQFLQAEDHINENCLPMEVSPQDPFYGQFNFRCLDYVRAGIVLNGTCYDYPIEQENQLTHTIDGSMIYGSDNKTAWSLRSFFGGKLLVQTTNDSRPFPPNSKSPHTDCRNPPSENICYVAGDDRVNQNIGITVCQILFLRLHNILCDKLTYLNPHWSDERLYQEARKIVGAVLQQITYKTYLPIILGEKYVKKYGLNISKCSSCTNHYDPAVNPSTISEFGAAAFRSFHSLVPRKIIFYDKCYKEYDFIYLDHYYFRPTIIQQPEVLDALIRGLAHQNPQRRDKCFSKTLTRYLFDNNDNDAFGTDEECFDMNRGRDMGLPPYNEIRALCGLKKANSFEDFSDVMRMESVQKLKSFYFSHKDVDMFVGGMMERRIPGTMVGPTFQCIIGEQYYNYMRGDRFYFENCGLPWSFTKGQLNAIYEVSLAWVLCETGDNIESIQYDVFRQPNECNPIVPCKDIPQMDLEPWKEHI